MQWILVEFSNISNINMGYLSNNAPRWEKEEVRLLLFNDLSLSNIFSKSNSSSTSAKACWVTWPTQMVTRAALWVNMFLKNAIQIQNE